MNDDALPDEIECSLADILLRRNRSQETLVRDLADRNPAYAVNIIKRAADLGFDVVRPVIRQINGSSEVGAYRILSEVGEGGFGIVYLAERTDSSKQRVAVKVLKPGLDSRRILAKFRQEARVLAAMDHPFVTAMRDSGTTTEGHAYFVMDYIDGESLSSYCGSRPFRVGERVELFAKVCEGVQHAHQKAIIHRDLSPNNILVTHDGKDIVPKIIDFGLARALDPDLALPSAVSFGGEGLAGTLPYMSPEQISPHRVLGPGQLLDTRTDVYSLGVVLYELLTGSAPFPVGLPVTAVELERQIVEESPPAMHDRCAKDHSRSRALRGDLRWIVQKAMEKDPERRYATPLDLARDLRRYLEHLPVEACPPSTLYRLVKFARRHRVVVIAASLLTCSMAAGITGTSIGFMREGKRAAELEQVVWFQEERLRQMDLELIGIDIRKGILERVRQRCDGDTVEGSDREQEVEKLLAGVNTADIARDIVLDYIFRPTVAAIGTTFETQPRVQATLLQAVALTERDLGLFLEAEQVQEQALAIRLRELGERHPDTLSAMDAMASLSMDLSQVQRAMDLAERTLEIRRADLGEEHPDTLNSVNNVAVMQTSENLESRRAKLAQVVDARSRMLGDDHLDTLSSMNNLAAVEGMLGNQREALRLSERVLKGRRGALGESHPDTLKAMHNVATLMHDLGDLDGARRLHQQSVALSLRVRGEEHPATLFAMNNLASLLCDQGDVEAAIALHERILAIRRRVLGESHPDVFMSMNNLAGALHDLGDLDGALEMHQQTLQHRRERFGEEHPDTLQSKVNVAAVWRDQGKGEEAAVLLESVFESRRRLFGEEHTETLDVMDSMADLRRDMGELEVAEGLYLRVVDGRKRVLGVDNPKTLESLDGFAQLRLAQGRNEDAAELLETVLQARRRLFGDEGVATLSSMSHLAHVRRATGDLDRAIELHELVVAARVRILSETHPNTLVAMTNLGLVLAERGLEGDKERAVRYLNTAYDGFLDRLGEEHPHTLRVDQWRDRLARGEPLLDEDR